LKGTLNLQTGVEDTLHLNERFYWRHSSSTQQIRC
jgi:hypothetical protein